MSAKTDSEIQSAINVLVSEGGELAALWANDLASGPPYQFEEVERWVNGDSSSIDDNLCQ